MSEEKPRHDELPLDQALLGMQGFNAARAERYRAEIFKLLADRMSTAERWWLALFAVVFLILLGVLPVIGASKAPVFQGLEETRWTFIAAFAAAGALLSGWLLWIAIKGAYDRRMGDVIAAIIASILCGGSGIACIEIAWNTDDPVLRIKMLFSGSIFLVIVLACLVITLLQRMHRQVQERLLRIDYHVAELMAKSSE